MLKYTALSLGLGEYVLFIGLFEFIDIVGLFGFFEFEFEAV